MQRRARRFGPLQKPSSSGCRARAEVQAASLLRVLGRGGTGTVWLVADAHHPGEQRALKIVSEAAEARTGGVAATGGGAAYAEEAMLAATHHPFIVRFFGSTNDGAKAYILTEACVGGDLSSLISARRAASAALDEAAARGLASCVVSALGATVELISEPQISRHSSRKIRGALHEEVGSTRSTVSMARP